MIINVSNPSNPDLVTNVSDTANYALGKPSDIATITLDSSTYALVTSYDDNGVQIINITDPRNPIPASAIFDDVDNYTELAGAKSIATITIGLSSFALVAASNDDGVQIINITDPYNPTPTSAITDGVGGYEELDGARSITTTTIGTSTYALVAAAYDDGVQIIDITDPRNPIPASAIFDGMGDYTKIAGAKSITTTTIDKSTYALVAISNYNGVQIINITNPYKPTATSNITHAHDFGGYNALSGISPITTTTIDKSTYAIVTSREGIQLIKLEHEYISAHTSNQNNKYAKAGDTLGINFTASDTIASHTGQILGLDVSSTATINGAVYDATVTVPSILMESYATFNITVANANDTSITMNENNISSSNVFIDTISPSIELVGPADYTILSGTPTSSIPNVTVSDGDPNYSGNFTIIKNATVDTAMIGSAYNYTYIADSDTAGNLGANVSRIITVIYVDPITITSLNITSNGALNNFANAGKNITVTLVTDSTDLGNFTGTLLGRDIIKEDVNNGIAEFTVTVLPNDLNGNVTFSITAINSSGNYVTFTQKMTSQLLWWQWILHLLVLYSCPHHRKLQMLELGCGGL